MATAAIILSSGSPLMTKQNFNRACLWKHHVPDGSEPAKTLRRPSARRSKVASSSASPVS